MKAREPTTSTLADLLRGLTREQRIERLLRSTDLTREQAVEIVDRKST